MRCVMRNEKAPAFDWKKDGAPEGNITSRMVKKAVFYVICAAVMLALYIIIAYSVLGAFVYG